VAETEETVGVGGSL